MENPKKISPEKHLEMEVANYVQAGIMKRFLKRELGKDFEKDEEKKIKMEMIWIKDHAPKFRAIFDANKEAMIEAYKKDKKSVMDLMEKILDDDL